MSGSPQLSVLMTVFNGGPYLADAVHSVLAPSFDGLELVVVDNVSTDGSREWLRQQTDPRLHLIENSVNLGQTGALQRGLEACRAPLVARLDADDLSEPGRFETQINAFRRDDALALVGGQALFIDERGGVLGKSRLPQDDGEIQAVMTVANPFIHSAVMFRRDRAMAVGGYDGGYAIAQDFALWSALMRAGYRLHNPADVVCRVRQHGAQLTASNLRQREAPEALRITTANQAWAMGSLEPDVHIAMTMQNLWLGVGTESDRSAIKQFFRLARRLTPKQKAWLSCRLAGGAGSGKILDKINMLYQAVKYDMSILLDKKFYMPIIKNIVRRRNVKYN